MKLIGLTGSIASGKSLVADMLLKLGASVIDADQIAREVVKPGMPAWKALVETFGEDILASDQTIEREKLGKIVFADDEARLKLNRITHPEIGREMASQIVKYQEKGKSFVVLEAALLLETDAKSMVNSVIVVTVDKDIQIQRLLKRDNISREEALQRIHSQMSGEEKAGQADYVISNSGSIEETEKQVHSLWQRLTDAEENG